MRGACSDNILLLDLGLETWNPQREFVDGNP